MAISSRSNKNASMSFLNALASWWTLLRPCARVGITACVVLTVLRIWLAVMTPTSPDMSAGYDTALFINEADSILRGNWLGEYTNLALCKTPGFALLLCVCAITGISYQVLSLGLWIAAVIAFCFAIRSLRGGVST